MKVVLSTAIDLLAKHFDTKDTPFEILEKNPHKPI